MEHLKKITILLLIIISTGCSVEYNLTINEDYSISEKVTALENTKKMESITRSKGEQSVTYLYNMFKRDNENINFTSNESSDNTSATATTTHNSIEEYSSKFKSDVFNKVNVTKNNGIVSLTTTQTTPLSDNDSYSLIYDDITIKIYVPFKVLENNADETSGDTYIWKIKKNDELKTIKLTYDENSKKNNVNIKINNKTFSINYVIITISGIILVIAVIVLIVVMKNKKNNTF
ncbi:MAG: hypothetical protein IJ105_02470 [Bacilli bacterium]|nr:hypothetical protein [Bacilli bacterium]